MTLEALREPDLTGIVVRIAFDEGSVAPHINGPGWEHASRIEAGKRTFASSSGSSSLGHLREAASWNETRDQVDEALALLPDQALVVRVTVTRTRKRP